MAIIYTYPVKTTPVDADLVLISDSADNNNTKQVTISSIKGLTAGVTSIIAGTNVTISSTGASGTGDVTVNAAGGGTFSIKERSKRTARNPKTGEKINVEPKKSLHFKTSKEMRKLLNEK